MTNFLVWDADDFGTTHIISDMCQSHDCRDKLDEFHYTNSNFKATLFAIPAQMTYELAQWCEANNSWIELAVHGIFHSSNYECEKMSYEEFDKAIEPLSSMIDSYFVKGFKAPGWQISDGIYKWLLDHGWWVSDKSYNDTRRPEGLYAYVNRNGNDFFVTQGKGDVEISEQGSHWHVWNTCSNGVYERSEDIKSEISIASGFKFISEVLNENL